MGEFAFKSGGVHLNARRWKVENAKATVVITHGYGHHGSSFAEAAERLNAAGLSVFAWDQRGHGKSEGERGYIESFDHTIGDLGAFLLRIRDRVVGKPLFLMGHSLGCLAVALYCIDDEPDVRGIIMSSGLLKIPDHVPKVLQKVAGVLGEFTPKLPVQRVNVEATSRDPAAVQTLRDDPLRYGGWMHARSGAEIAKAVARLQDSMDRLSHPMLIMHGSDDRLTDSEGSRELYARARATDKTLRIFEGGYHELYNDLDKERFYRELIEWVNTRV
ncbi:MAG: lysophospholipase [Candidatus Hydrogenedentota bacterium]